MKLNSSNLSFKGYDACPIRNVYFDEENCDLFYPEMNEIAKEENFGLIRIYDDSMWMQDNKILIQTENNSPKLLHGGHVSSDIKHHFEINNIKPIKAANFIAGGNCFIGKYEDGRKWMLVGGKDGYKKAKMKNIKETYGVDEENVFIVPQRVFHIDMFLRPVGYPYILVDDPDLVLKQLKKLDDGSLFMEEYIDRYETNKEKKDEKGSVDEVVAILKDAGFIPIRIAGEYGDGINFMNAIVNKHKNGSISYITNSSKTPHNNVFSKIQDIFEEELKQKLPNLDRIHFVRGYEKDAKSENKMLSILKNLHGGIHWLSLEEPNFDVWA